MDKRIGNFINAQSVFSMCTAVDSEPHCASCMYAFLEERQILIFSSDASTRHIRNAFSNKKVAGTILPDRFERATIRGIQFAGTFKSVSPELESEVRRQYYRKYPFALAMKGQLWLIQLETVKMTDNTLGFGTKLVWNLK